MRQCGRKMPAYLTVYLAMVLGVLVSLCLVLIEGVRKGAVALEAECVAEVAVNSVMAEYHRELFRQYNLFAIDASYGTPYASVENIQQHLRRYIDRNLSLDDIFLSDFLYKDFLKLRVNKDENTEITGVSIYTDEGGSVFRAGAVDAVKDDVGLNLLSDLQQWTNTVNSNVLLSRDITAELRRLDAEIDSYDGTKKQISETEWITLEVDNPAEGVVNLWQRGVLNTVIENPALLSCKRISLQNLVGERMRQSKVTVGNIAAERDSENTLTERFFFQEYLLRYMGYYGGIKDAGALDYQIEYLLSGKSSDVENLKSVADKLCLLRGAANAAYLFADTEKCSQAEMVGYLLAALCGVPEAGEAFQMAILFGWAYAESLYDVEMLLAGGRIPLLKSDAAWHYDLDSALGVNGFQGAGGAQEGLSYEDYLRIFMMCTDMDTLTERAMNLVEANIRLTPGNAYFRLDACCAGIQAEVRISSDFAYSFEKTIGKKY